MDDPYFIGTAIVLALIVLALAIGYSDEDHPRQSP